MTQTTDPTLLNLPPVMNLRAAAPLAREMLALRGTPVALDASNVERIGGLCLQVLLSAQMTWRADGVALRLINPSSAFLESAATLGALADREVSHS
jgi:chemotaxis protein CheX